MAITPDKTEGKLRAAGQSASWEALGDFITAIRVLPNFALAIGVLAAFVALAVLRLIGRFTNLFYFGRSSTALVSPAGNHLGIFSFLVPIGGALIIGVMARYGSERIRGHGIPEAIEGILINGSRFEPKVAFLKPLSSAISIGSGGLFGAEGRMPVVERARGKFPGLVSVDDLLKVRARHLEQERRRERTLKSRFLLPGGRVAEQTKIPVAH